MLTVSIVVPAYQAAAHVGNAVRSALAQTMNDLELLVVDDGSRDGTAVAAYAAAAGDPRLRVIRQPENRGVSAARNTALSVARGRWIALLDADDTFAEDRLQRLVAAAEAREADLLADHVLLVRDDGAQPMFTVPARNENEPLDARQFIVLDSPTNAIGFMKPLIRRAFLEEQKLRYPDGINAGEDFHLYVRCLLRGARLFVMKDAAYVANARTGSLSRSNAEEIFATFARSTQILHAEAVGAGQRAVARQLARRAADLRYYATYDRFSSEVHQRHFLAAAPIFCKLSLQPYTWRRFGSAARRRLLPQ
jgi:glycosyltransferase involved in cell wall biosynthesis